MVGESVTRWAQPLAAALLLAMAACAPAPPENKLVLAPVPFADVPGWHADRQSEALPALLRSCMSLAQRQDSAPAGPGDAFGRVADWRPACAAAGLVPPGDDDAARLYFDRWFKPFRALNGDRPAGFLTGYYEPELRGSRVADARFSVPLYRRPADLVTAELGDFRDTFRGERIAGRVVDGRLRPYANRAAIDAGALDGRGLELLWVDDPVDAFFLHVQGSGRILLVDGSVVRVGYSAANGHAYTAIGRELIARGEVAREAMSMQAIRDWLATHPTEAKSVMAANASYVFFRELEGDGPVGSQGVVLTPGRSLAVDPRFMALGAPVWIDSLDPLTPEVPLRRLMVAQDTGGAIRGPLRGDVFWGNGPDAAARAGRMQSSAELYVLLPAAAVPAPTN